MKKIFFIATLSLLILTSVYARKIEGDIIFQDRHTEHITFLIPFGFLSSTPAYVKLQDVVRYLAGDKKQKIMPEDVSEISFLVNGIKVRMISVEDNLQMSSSWTRHQYRLLKLEVDGVVRLFDYYATSYSPGFYGGGGMMTAGTTYVYDRYVLQRDNDELVRPRGISFRKDMAEYFADCPDLVDKINSKLLKKADLEIIVKEYNANCN